ncbi:MAG: hypothetical protein SF053_05135 [Bacteroidia bacterium]|nr:hypothetical protein [Bacteroidia bacterium]
MPKQVVIISLLLGMCGGWSLGARSQPGDQICLGHQVLLRARPGGTGSVLATVWFGEQVTLLGESASDTVSGRVYVRMRTAEGRTGWADTYMFSEGEGAAVVLAGMPVYQRPMTPTTITDQVTRPGDIVIVLHRVGEWTEIAGRDRTPHGWIRGGNVLSTAVSDLELATLMATAEAEPQPDVRREKLDQLVTMAANSPLQPLLAARRDALPPPRDPVRAIPVQPAAAQALPEQAVSAGTVELTGAIFVLPASAATPGLFDAAHASLPFGSKVVLYFPDNEGFVELTITSRLPAGNKALIGISRTCYELVYGTQPGAKARISYTAPISGNSIP